MPPVVTVRPLCGVGKGAGCSYQSRRCGRDESGGHTLVGCLAGLGRDRPRRVSWGGTRLGRFGRLSVPELQPPVCVDVIGYEPHGLYGQTRIFPKQAGSSLCRRPSPEASRVRCRRGLGRCGRLARFKGREPAAPDGTPGARFWERCDLFVAPACSGTEPGFALVVRARSFGRLGCALGLVPSLPLA